MQQSQTIAGRGYWIRWGVPGEWVPVKVVTDDNGAFHLTDDGYVTVCLFGGTAMIPVGDLHLF